MIKQSMIVSLGLMSLCGSLCFADELAGEYRATELASLREAAQSGDADAAFALAQAYELGDGIPKSAESALTWYEQAAENHPLAALRYAQIALANSDRLALSLLFDPVERLEFAAGAGVSEAQFILAMMLQTGQRVDPDPVRARELLEIAADDWFPARSALGTLEHKSRNFEVARKHFEAALDAGDPTGAAYLGYYAERGIGESIDRQKALLLYRQADGVDWAKAAADRLKERDSSIIAFGLPMYATYRAEVGEYFLARGIVKVGGEEYFDAFNVTNFVGGRPTILTVAYAPGTPEYVAELNYQFERVGKETTRALHDELKSKLEKKYGPPDSEKRKQGVYTVTWMHGQARIQLQVASRLKHATVTYQLRPFVDSLRNYVAERDRKKRGVLDDAL